MSLEHPAIVGATALGVVQLAEMIPTDPDTISLIAKTLVQLFIGVVTLIKLLKKPKQD